jgi:anaerobic selenocysteine-containing dehydrogenase
MGNSVSTDFMYENIELYIKEIATKIQGLTPSRDFNSLKKNGIWHQEGQKPEFQSYTSQGFNTPSNRIEIALKQNGISPLPTYHSDRERINLAKDELILVPYNVNVMRPDLTNLKWLAEIHHSNTALINSKTARHLKIKSGDDLIIESEVGQLKIKAHVTEGVHPEVIAISNSLGHWKYGRIAQAQQFESEDPDTEFIWWEEKGNGTHPNFIIPTSVDKIGKGQGWMDTKVKVKKA